MPVFIWAPEEEGQFQPGRCSRWWLQNSLQALEGDLRALGSSLIYRCAPESRTALLQLVQEAGAQVGRPCQIVFPAVTMGICCRPRTALALAALQSCLTCGLTQKHRAGSQEVQFASFFFGAGARSYWT